MENDEAPAEAAHWQADFSADEVMAAANASDAKVDALESIAVGGAANPAAPKRC